MKRGRVGRSFEPARREASIESIPSRTKLAYGTAELGFVSVEVLVELYLLKFYNTVLGLAPVWTALAMAIAVLWDAVSDPIMGGISDRTRHRMGRRRPWIVPGSVGLAASLVLIFNPPGIDGQLPLFLFLLGGYLAITTFMTIASVPHIALGGELSFDRNERTIIFGYRRLFTTLGLVAGTVIPPLVLRALGGGDAEDAIRRSRGVTALILVAPIVITAWISVRATRGYDTRQASGEWKGLRMATLLREQILAMRNPAFLPLLAAFVVAGIGRALNASIAFYYYEYRLGFSEARTVFGVLLPFFAGIILSVPFWAALSRRAGKKMPAFWAIFALGLLVSVSYPLLAPGDRVGAFALAVVGGALAGSIILYESLVADMVDYDELRTRRNREGIYFGVWKMGVKISRALGLLISGAMLGAIGFDEGARVQGAGTLQWLTVLFGPGVGLFFMIGASLMLWMPLTETRHRRIQALLLRRRMRDREHPTVRRPTSIPRGSGN